MKTLLLLISLQVFYFSNAIWAKTPLYYITTSDKVIVFTDPLFTGPPKAVKPEVITDNAIRVIAAPGKEIFSRSKFIQTLKCSSMKLTKRFVCRYSSPADG